MGIPCWRLSAKNEKGYQVDSSTWSKDLGYLVNGEYSMAVVQANRILEDQSQLVSGPLSSSNAGPQGTFVGVYDGHGGPEAARFIKDNLFNNVQKFTKEHQDISADVIHRAYAATEADFLSLVAKEWTTKPQIAAVGSGCLVGIIRDETLYIANVGNSRVVLGRRAKKNKGVDAIQLSAEHDVNIESVRRELQSFHPDDSQIVVYKHGVWRVKGIIKVSRSIGDAYLKNAQFNREPLYAKYRLHEPFQKPILSSEPSVLVTKLKPEDLYLIFASDGLWELLSSQDVVDIVHKYPRNGIARRLVKAAMQEVAKKREMRYSDLTKIDRGVRTHFHDDISVIVVFLDSLLPNKFSKETRRYIPTVSNIPDSSETGRDTCCPTFWKFRADTSKVKTD